MTNLCLNYTAKFEIAIVGNGESRMCKRMELYVEKTQRYNFKSLQW